MRLWQNLKSKFAKRKPLRCAECRAPFDWVNYPLGAHTFCSPECQAIHEEPPDQLVKLLQYPP